MKYLQLFEQFLNETKVDSSDNLYDVTYQLWHSSNPDDSEFKDMGPAVLKLLKRFAVDRSAWTAPRGASIDAGAIIREQEMQQALDTIGAELGIYPYIRIGENGAGQWPSPDEYDRRDSRIAKEWQDHFDERASDFTHWARLRTRIHPGKRKNATRDLSEKMQRAYSDWQRGLIVAWGQTLYLEYHNLDNKLDTVSRSKYEAWLSKLARTKKDSVAFERMFDMLSENPPMLDGKALWDKSTLEADFNAIANSTPTPEEITIYRVAVKEEDGVNSYTFNKDGYGYLSGEQRAYRLPKGTPVIFAHAIADIDEVIWNPSNSDLRKYRI